MIAWPSLQQGLWNVQRLTAGELEDLESSRDKLATLEKQEGLALLRYRPVYFSYSNRLKRVTNADIPSGSYSYLRVAFHFILSISCRRGSLTDG